MADIAFRFNGTKAIEAIVYLSRRVSESDIYGICKLLYLADKTSLEKYGRFIFGETYWAMEEGATPSHAYNLIKQVAEIPSDGFEVKGYQIKALREANLDYLSESDVECLDQIVGLYGKAPNWVRGQAAHDDAWKKAWDKRSVNMPVETIAEQLSNPVDLIEYICNSDAP